MNDKNTSVESTAPTTASSTTLGSASTQPAAATAVATVNPASATSTSAAAAISESSTSSSSSLIRGNRQPPTTPRRNRTPEPTAAVSADENEGPEEDEEDEQQLTALEFLNEFLGGAAAAAHSRLTNTTTTTMQHDQQQQPMSSSESRFQNSASSLFDRSTLFRENFNQSILSMGQLGATSSSGASTSSAAQQANNNNNSSQTVLSLNQEVNSGQQFFNMQQTQQQQQQQQQQGQTGADGTDQDGNQPGTNPINGIFGVFLKTLQTSVPFVFILFAKILHQHLIGFFIVLGFMTTLHFSNKTLLNQIQLKDKKENYKLMLLILFLLANIAVFFSIFGDYRLENCLVFLSPSIPKMDTWNLLWIVVCTDTIIKFIIISVKALLTLLPFRYLPLRKRGSFYSAVESFGLFYRYLTPIHPWILYLLYSESPTMQLLTPDLPSSSIAPSLDAMGKHLRGDGIGGEDIPSSGTVSPTLFTVLLCILYLLFKLNQIYGGLNDVARSMRELIGDFSYGMPVSISEFDENVCPICQDKFSNPVILKCKHTFCQDCVCMWLDKENSCPMCRAKILVKKPKFKDGSTSAYVQWF